MDVGLSSSGLKRSNSRLKIQVHVQGVLFSLDKELVAAKSEKISAILRQNPQDDLSHVFRDIPTDPNTFELFARFCHGFDITISPENVVPLSCLAYYLNMTEQHSPNNLLNMAVQFFKKRILPSWNETVKALRAADCMFEHAMILGLVDVCSESIVDKAVLDPRLLGDLSKNSNYNDDDNGGDGNVYRPNARKRLFVQDWKSEDLTNLSLRIYKPIVSEMIQRQVPSKYIALSLYNYAKKWVTTSINEREMENQNELVMKKMETSREVIESIETLLPHEKGLLPCIFLFEMLRLSIMVEAKPECRNGFELRIGKQLENAKVQDLLVPSQGYAKEVQYDIECVKRIVKHFYGNYSSSNVDGLIKVAELIEGLLCEIAIDIDLKLETFMSLAEISCAASSEALQTLDGIYRAIDLYLEKHKYLTESEKEEVCNLLDCQKLSIEACDHAVKNKLLPLRVIVQILFVSQLKIRGTVTRDLKVGNENGREVMRLENQMSRLGNVGEKEVMVEMEKKVVELKRECSLMRKEIENGCSNGAIKKKNFGVWKEMKRKLGCLSIHDYNCHEMRKKKKVHPSKKTKERK